MIIRFTLSLLLATGCALSSAAAADAPATAADICKAAPENFAMHAVIAPKTLMTRIDALGITLNDRDSHVVDDSCKFTALPGLGGFAALPSLHLGAKDGSGVELVLQVGTHDGVCQAVVVNLQGC